MRIKHFILNSDNIEKDTFIWNMVGSMLMAFQSVIMLVILTRTVGLVESGIFTIAYANANLFLTIGKYGMRNFQVSDARKQYTFGEYLHSREMTTIAMIIVSGVYILITATTNQYALEKTMVIIVMCLFKVTDVIEDVYHGLYQQKGRLDVAAKAMAVRMAATIFVYGSGLIILKDQLKALIIATIFTTIVLVVFTRWTYVPFKQDAKVGKGNVGSLLKSCFPLFVGSFLAFYIGNAPKYAIDSLLTDELQACYGFIAMPVFVIGLLNSFIFNPMLFHLSRLWEERKIRKFLKKVTIQIGVIVCLTLICVVGAYLIGIPVLSMLYNTNLGAYKSELLVLLVGGGFLGLSGLLNAVITIIRFQNCLIVGYGIAAIAAYLLSNFMVKSYGMMGAAVLYLGLMAILCLCFLFFMGIGMIKNRKRV